MYFNKIKRKHDTMNKTFIVTIDAQPANYLSNVSICNRETFSVNHFCFRSV